MKQTIRLEGLDCANCAAKMERGISALPGVRQCQVNFLTGKMMLDMEDGREEAALEAAEKIIHKLEPDVVIRKA